MSTPRNVFIKITDKIIFFSKIDKSANMILILPDCVRRYA